MINLLEWLIKESRFQELSRINDMEREKNKCVTSKGVAAIFWTHDVVFPMYALAPASSNINDLK